MTWPPVRGKALLVREHKRGNMRLQMGVLPSSTMIISRLRLACLPPRVRTVRSVDVARYEW